MNDNDIIKALERCIKCNDRQIANCDGCLLEKYYPYCDEELEIMCLDLINRQNAEIKRLEEEKDGFIRKYEEANGKGNIKFETGDYAKIVGNHSSHEFEIGTIVKLEKCDEDYKAFANNDYWWVTDVDLTDINDNSELLSN